MSDVLVARRYAQALHEQAERARLTDRVDEDISLIHDTVADSRELAMLFSSPVVSRERKAAALNALFGERVHAQVMGFIDLLVSKRREDLFPEVVRAYRALRDDQLGIVEAAARTARPLTEDEERSVRAALERITGKRIRLSSRVDTDLLGGIVIRVGDTVYDGSVRNQLTHLREQLASGAISTN